MSKLFFIFPVEGPINGVKIIAGEVLQRMRAEGIPLELIDTAQAKDHKDFGTFSVKKVLSSFSFFKRIKDIKAQDIVYLNFTPNGLSFYRDLAFLKLLGRKNRNTFIHIHANGLEYKSGLAKKLLRNTHCIVINQRQYENLSFFKNRYLLPNALPDYYAENWQPARVNPKFRLLYISNFSLKKGTKRLQKLATWIEDEQLDCELILAGGVLDTTSEEILNQLRQKPFVRYLGFVTEKAEKMELIKSSDVVLMLSDDNYEVYPLIYIESFMAGTTVLTTPQTVDSDFLKNGVALRFNRENLLFLYGQFHDEQVKKEHTERARNYYLQHMEFGLYFDRLKKILFHE
ncbi:MAG: glycosyltransferase [Weeksellaceae bacterium]|nr:glycosyltransferase [Weeksellaceae bacterium]